jgi:pilus assembly protein Flp/PilA
MAATVWTARSLSEQTGALREYAPEEERDVMNLITYVRRLLKNESGQDLLEYALLVALIALVCVAVITSTGSGVKTIFTNINSALTTAATP